MSIDDARLDSYSPYEENCSLLTSVVKRYVRLIGPAGAVAVARRVPGLIVDDRGNVLAYDPENPLGTVRSLIDEYEMVFGENAVALPFQLSPTIGETLNDDGRSELADASQPGHISTLRILLVDDHVLFRQGLAGLINPQPDFTVVGEASTVEEAVRKAHDLRPDVVLMDISLPDGTGLEAAQDILIDCPEIKIVYLTVHDDDETLFAAIRGGGSGYLPKSVSAVELFSRLRGLRRGEAAISPGIARRILQEFSRLPGPREPGITPSIELTPREVEIMRALAIGSTNREIADRLFISEHTVKNHVKHVLAKLRLHSRQEAADYARVHGLFPSASASSG